MTNVEALKLLYTGLGGESDTVADAKTIVEVLNAIADLFDGEDNAQMNAEAIANIASVAESIVTPTLEDTSVTPTTSEQTITAGEGYDGLGTVTVSAVTAAIDANITAANIKSGVTILGVAGSYTGE